MLPPASTVTPDPCAKCAGMFCPPRTTSASSGSGVMDNLSTYLVLCSWRKPRGFIWKRPYHSAQPLPSALGFGGRKNVKHSSRRASTIALCGITFFYEHTLKRAWSPLTFVRAPREKKLQEILSVEEVRTLLAHLKLLRSRACLTTLSSCGLRLQEGTHLPVPDLDSARLLVHVRHGTGA